MLITDGIGLFWFNTLSAMIQQNAIVYYTTTLTKTVAILRAHSLNCIPNEFASLTH